MYVHCLDVTHTPMVLVAQPTAHAQQLSPLQDPGTPFPLAAFPAAPTQPWTLYQGPQNIHR